MGSHLHFEVRVGTNQYDNTRNPALWLFPRTDENGQQYGVLAGRLKNPQDHRLYVNVKVEYFINNREKPDQTFYVETYALEKNPVKSNKIYHENFVIPDLHPGSYRITFSIPGQRFEQWVEVESGKLTFVAITSNSELAY